MSFNLGNAVKYVWRSGNKGNLIEDLKKSVWYLNQEIKRLSYPLKQHRGYDCAVP